MRFTAREMALRLSPQPNPFILMPVCDLCDTTGGAPAPPCPAPSGIAPEDYTRPASLEALRTQLRNKLSQS